jgi:hypothetical protein
VVAIELRRIEQDLILHDRAAEARVIGHAAHLLVLALEDPVLPGFEFLRAAIGTFDHIAVDKAGRAGERRERGRHACGVLHFA